MTHHARTLVAALVLSLVPSRSFAQQVTEPTSTPAAPATPAATTTPTPEVPAAPTPTPPITPATPPATSPPASNAPPAPETPAQLQEAPGLVPLRVRARVAMPVGVVIPSPTGGDSTRRDLCFTPCELWVRPGPFALSVGGSPFRWTIADLQIPTSGLGVVLRTGRSAPYTGGFATAVVSAAFLVAGPILWGAAPPLTSASVPRPAPGAVEMWATGGALLGVGVVGLAVGLGLMLANPVGIANEQPLWRASEAQ